MYETIYNVPGSQGEMMEGNCENSGPRMEEKFIKATTHEWKLLKLITWIGD